MVSSIISSRITVYVSSIILITLLLRSAEGFVRLSYQSLHRNEGGRIKLLSSSSTFSPHLRIRKRYPHVKRFSNLNNDDQDIQFNEEEKSSPISREVDLIDGLWPVESRQLLGLFGILGFLETLFLSYQKLVVGDLTSLCSIGGSMSLRCGDVLNSEYASLFGVPFTVPAVFAYGTVAYLALRPLLLPEGSRERAEADLFSRDPLLLLTTGMATFSAYLMYLLVTELREFCPFCLVSASLSLGSAILTWSKKIVPDATKAAIYKGGSILVTALFSFSVYIYASARVILFTGSSLTKGEGGLLHAPPSITTHSDERSMQVANKLASLDAKMYGAFWCSHCFEQKQTLGKEAYAKIHYIECAPDGLNSESKTCRSRKVPGYPTWEVRGDLYPGEKTLEQLEDIADGKVPPPPPIPLPEPQPQ